MKQFVLCLAGLVGTTLSLPAESSVWKITKGSSTVYMGGTVHMLRASDLPLPPEFERAFAASSVLVFETDIAATQSPAMQKTIMEKGVFTDGKSLETELSAKAWAAVETYCQKSGLPADQMKTFRPWLFVIMTAALEMQKLGLSAEGVDQHLFNKAGPAGKKTGELETIDEQIAFLVNMGKGHESEMVIKSIEDAEKVATLIPPMIAAWKAGDLSKLDSLVVNEVRQKYPMLYGDLFLKRNEAWLPKIEALAKSPEVEFVLVGAAHVAGEEGLLAQLEKRGYKVEQLKAEKAEKAK
jgi:uncharacterized protein